MTLRKFIILTVVFFSLVSCLRGQGSDNRQDKGKSRVEYFYYGGYSDTIYALIHGRVYERETTATGRDTLMPLSNVAVQIEQNSKSTTTNGSGEFDIGLAKGVYSLMVSKQGYEPIQLTGYVSDPDQVSATKIILVKGKEQRIFEIPKRTK